MTFVSKIREIAARRALHNKIHAEMAAITDDELKDLDLSYARIAELSRAQAYGA
jgi:hypothetical protein